VLNEEQPNEEPEAMTATLSAPKPAAEKAQTVVRRVVAVHCSAITYAFGNDVMSRRFADVRVIGAIRGSDRDGNPLEPKRAPGQFVPDLTDVFYAADLEGPEDQVVAIAAEIERGDGYCAHSSMHALRSYTEEQWEFLRPRQAGQPWENLTY
jgi:hypothetical protein